MINKIIGGICEKLNVAFGGKYRIYTEQVKQGLKNPCFFVQCINPTNTQVLGNRYFRNNLFCVQFFPAEEDVKAECYAVQEALFLALEYITVDGGSARSKAPSLARSKAPSLARSKAPSLLRGTKMDSGIVDGVLNFFVNFDMYVYTEQRRSEAPYLCSMPMMEQSSVPNMGKLELLNTNLKG